MPTISRKKAQPVVRTVSPQLCDINLASSIDLLKKYTNYYDSMSEFSDQIETAINFRSTFFYNDTVKRRIDFFNSLSEKFRNYDTDFVVYWYELANTMPEYIKSEITQSTLNIRSDSIGKFTNSKCVLDDSTSNIADFSMNAQPPPAYTPYNAENKISPWTKQILDRASFRVNNMYRSSISVVQPENYTSKTSHGVNLVGDTFHFDRMNNEVKTAAFNRLKSSIKDDIKIISYFCNLNDMGGYNAQDYQNNNLQKYIPSFDIEIDVERVTNKIDLLTNKIKFIKQRIYNDEVLSTEQIETIKPDEKTTEQLDRLRRANNVFEVYNIKFAPKTFFKKNLSEEQKGLTSISDAKKEMNVGTTGTKTNDNIFSELAASIVSIPTTKFYPTNAAYTTYKTPEWLNELTNCLGIGNVVDLFNGIEDPLTVFANLSSTAFDLFDSLSQINPFGINFSQVINFAFRFVNNFDFDSMLSNFVSEIQNIDVSKIFSTFSSALPIPSFSLGDIFDFFSDPSLIIDEISDKIIERLENAVIDLFKNLICSTAQTALAGGGIGGFNVGGIPNVGGIVSSIV